jgi:hypothetical protein
VNLEHRLEKLEGKRDPWRQGHFAHVSDDALRAIFARVIPTVNPEEKAYLESLRRDLFGDAQPDGE